jgi:hypothetical protein
VFAKNVEKRAINPKKVLKDICFLSVLLAQFAGRHKIEGKNVTRTAVLF